MFKISVYIPATHVEIVKQAMFSSGAGCYKYYDQACFQYKGTGQFRPLKGSHPTTGQENEVTYVDEYKVEMLCPLGDLEETIKSMILAHPYEVVAYDVIKLYLFSY